MNERDLDLLLTVFRALRDAGARAPTAWALVYRHITDQPKEQTE